MAADVGEVREGYRDALAWLRCCLDDDGEGAAAVLWSADPVMMCGAFGQLLIDEVERQGVSVREWIADRQAAARAELAGLAGGRG